jgi:hypothetical protein
VNDWAQSAAREICELFPPETPRPQSEFVAEVIRRHADAAAKQCFAAIGRAVRAMCQPKAGTS